MFTVWAQIVPPVYIPSLMFLHVYTLSNGMFTLKDGWNERWIAQELRHLSFLTSVKIICEHGSIFPHFLFLPKWVFILWLVNTKIPWVFSMACWPIPMGPPVLCTSLTHRFKRIATDKVAKSWSLAAKLQLLHCHASRCNSHSSGDTPLCESTVKET